MIMSKCAYYIALIWMCCIYVCAADLQMASWILPSTLTTNSSKVNFTLGLKNVPNSPNTNYNLILDFPRGFISSPGSYFPSGSICTTDATNVCVSQVVSADAACFFKNAANPSLLVTSCDAQVPNFGVSGFVASYPTSLTRVLVFYTGSGAASGDVSSIQVNVPFLVPPAYPTDASTSLSVSVYVTDASQVSGDLTPLTNVLSLAIPSVTIGQDFKNNLQWYARINSGDLFLSTPSAQTVSQPSLFLDVQVSNPTPVINAHLFNNDAISIQLPPSMVLLNSNCYVFYNTLSINQALIPSTYTQSYYQLTSLAGTTSTAVLKFPTGVNARPSFANPSLRIICSNLAFKVVPTSTASLAINVNTIGPSPSTAAKSSLFSFSIASTVNAQVMAPLVSITGTSAIVMTANANLAITFPYLPVPTATTMTLSIPPNVGFSAMSACTMNGVSVAMVFNAGMNTVTLTLTAPLILASSLICTLAPPYYEQNDVSGSVIALTETSTGLAIASNTFTWINAKAGVWNAASIFQLTNYQAGSPPSTAVLRLIDTSVKLSVGNVLTVNLPSAITMNAGGSSVCQLKSSYQGTTTNVASTTLVTGGNGVAYKITSTINADSNNSPIRIISLILDCTQVQAPPVVTTGLVGSATLTNNVGKFLMRLNTLNIKAGDAPTFGSIYSLALPTPPETSTLVNLVLSINPVLQVPGNKLKIIIPTAYQQPSAAITPKCNVLFQGATSTVTYEPAGGWFFLDFTSFPAITTIATMNITCPNFFTPAVTKASTTTNVQIITPADSVVATKSFTWSAIVPGISTNKLASLSNAVVNSLSDITLSLQAQYMVQYSLNGVLHLTFPAGWGLDFNSPTTCTMSQGNALSISSLTVDSVSATPSITIVSGGSTTATLGNVVIVCTNVRTYRGVVDKHLIKYNYQSETGVILEETNVLLPTLSPAPLGLTLLALNHTDLRPSGVGVLSMQLNTYTNPLYKDESLIFTLPIDFTVAAGTVTNQPGVCSVTQGGVSLPGVTTITSQTINDNGFVGTQLSVKYTFSGTTPQSLPLSSLDTTEVLCVGVTIHPYAWEARNNILVYTQTLGGYKLDESLIGTFPEIEPASLGITTRALTHTPGRAGSIGSLSVLLNPTSTTIFAGYSMVIETPALWSISGVCGVTGKYTSNSVDTNVDMSCERYNATSSFILIKLITGTVPAGAIIDISLSNIQALPYSAPALSTISVYTRNTYKYLLDRTRTATLNAILPGDLGSDIRAIFASPFDATMITTVTFMVLPLPNPIPVNGYIIVDLIASPSFPQVQPGITCKLLVNDSLTITGTTYYTTSPMQLHFTPSATVPALALTELICTPFKNPVSETFKGKKLNMTTYTAGGTIIDRTTEISLDSGYPVRLGFQTQPAPSALVNLPFTTIPAVTGYDYFGQVATAKASISLSLVIHPSGDPNAELHGNLTQTMISSLAYFPGLLVTQTGFGYQLRASVRHGADTDSTTFNVWEGTSPTKFAFASFPYIEVVDTAFSVSAYVRVPGSMAVDSVAVVPISFTLYDEAGTDVSALMNGPITVTSVAGYANTTVTIPTTGIYTIQAFSTAGFFLASSTPRFSIVKSEGQKKQDLFNQDTQTVRAYFSVIGVSEQVLQDSTLRQEFINNMMNTACEYLSYYFKDQCGRLSYVSFENGQFKLDIKPNPSAGQRPTSLEMAEVLRMLILDLSSGWYDSDMGSFTGGSFGYTVSSSSDGDTWMTVGIVSGSLGAGVLSIGGAVLYRLRF